MHSNLSFELHVKVQNTLYIHYRYSVNIHSIEHVLHAFRVIKEGSAVGESPSSTFWLPSNTLTIQATSWRAEIKINFHCNRHLWWKQANIDSHSSEDRPASSHGQQAEDNQVSGDNLHAVGWSFPQSPKETVVKPCILLNCGPF
jgi:hypothetical protein